MSGDNSNPFADAGRRDFDHDAVERFPWPVVVGYADVHRWMDDGQAVHAAWQLRDVWEAFVKFLASVAVADRLSGRPGDDPPTRRLLATLFNPKGLSLGHWARLLEHALKETPAAALRLPALKELLFPARRPRLLPLLDGNDQSFVAWRNRRFGHGVFGRELAVYAREATAYLDKLHDAFDLCRDFLGGLVLESDDPAGGPLTWGGQSPLEFYHAHRPAPSAPAVHDVRIHLPGGTGTLDLGPLLSVQPCEVCGRWSAFFYDGFDRKKSKAFFLDVLDGHPNKPRPHDRLSAWHALPREEEPAAGPDERRGPAPERFRNFKDEFEPPVYLAERIAAFMGSHDRGIVLLTGPGGVGKSWVSQGLDASEMLPKARGRAAALLYTSVHGPKIPTAAEVLAELRTAAKTKGWYVPDEVDAPTPDARLCGWLAALMRQNPRAAELVIVLDGLDELAADSDVPALLPTASALPPHCYLILTSRPERRAALQTGLARARSAGAFAKYFIGSDTPEHRAVLQRYARKQLAMPRSVDDPQPLPAEWADGLIDLASGSFLYVFHYCRALQFGVYDSLATLPPPSRFYPAFFAHLRARVGERLFEDYYARVLALIAVAGEPIGLRHLEACGLERGRLAVVLDDLADLLRSLRRPGDEETLYTLGHAAIEQFVRTDAEWRSRLARENRFLAELTVRRFGDDWYAVDPFDSVESFLLFSLLRRVPATPEQAAEGWARELRQQLYGQDRLASACLEHGNRLQEMRRPDRSVLAYSLAATLRRDQVERQGRVEQSGNLAIALINRGGALPGLGRLDEALTDCAAAVETFRGLVGAGRAELADDLARALSGRGNALQALGRLEEALADHAAAAETYRGLVDAGRAEAASDLAIALNNRGLALREMGRLEEALADYAAAAETFRGMVDAGRVELADDLAMVLNNRGLALRALGRQEEALADCAAAVETFRGLVDAGRAELTSDLARALNNRGSALFVLGRLEEALVDYAAAAETYRGLVNAGRTELADDLAMALNNRGNTLAYLGRLEEALVNYATAAETYRSLVDAGRAELAANLAAALTNRGSALQALGRPVDALADYAAAVETYRGLVIAGRVDLANDLARCLVNLAILLEGQTEWEQALACYAYAIRLREARVRAGMSHIRHDLLQTIRRRLMAFCDLGRWEDAAADVRRFLSHANAAPSESARPDAIRDEVARFVRVLRALSPEACSILLAALGDDAAAVRRLIDP